MENLDGCHGQPPLYPSGNLAQAFEVGRVYSSIQEFQVTGESLILGTNRVTYPSHDGFFLLLSDELTFRMNCLLLIISSQVRECEHREPEITWRYHQADFSKELRDQTHSYGITVVCV